MTFLDATASYEGWLARQITIIPADLDRKHRLMNDDAFTFFRGTYYRWLQRMPRLAPELDGPVVACVGDLHMENFGSWRSRGGHLAWGVNDFDESEGLPYTFDLARLATSATLAIEEQKVAIDAPAAHTAILRGYTDQLTGDGAPFLLDGSHERLARLVAAATPEPTKWWNKSPAAPSARTGLHQARPREAPDARQRDTAVRVDGRETANIHLGSPERVAAIRDDLRRRGSDWLSRAARTLAEATREDWQEWHKDYDNRPPG